MKVIQELTQKEMNLLVFMSYLVFHSHIQINQKHQNKVYEKDKGANFYMAKYIDKEIDYDIFGL